VSQIDNDEHYDDESIVDEVIGEVYWHQIAILRIVISQLQNVVLDH
jgi:hypothetical protein